MTKIIRCASRDGEFVGGTRLVATLPPGTYRFHATPNGVQVWESERQSVAPALNPVEEFKAAAKREAAAVAASGDRARPQTIADMNAANRKHFGMVS